MTQPDMDYYIVGMIGLVEPQLHGPFQTEDEQQQHIDKLRQEEGEHENTFFVLNVSKGAEVQL